MPVFRHRDDEHGRKTTNKKSIGDYTRDNKDAQQIQEKIKMEWAERF